MDQAGPVARSVADLALFDRVVTGGAAAPTATPLKGVRIGIPPFYLAGLDPEVERATGEAFRKLRDAGVVLVEADVPEAVKSAFDVTAAIMLYETMPSIVRFLRDQNTGLTFDQVLGQVSEGMQGFIKAVALPPNRPPQGAYEAMLAQRERLKDAVRRHFEQHGIVALAFPAVTALPPRIGEEAEVEIDGKKVSFFTAFGRNTALSPAAGMAGLVLPIGLSSGGLPVALEFDALAGRDGDLLSLGLSLEQALGTIPAPKA